MDESHLKRKLNEHEKDINLLLFKLVFMHGVSSLEELKSLMFVDKIITKQYLISKLKEMGITKSEFERSINVDNTTFVREWYRDRKLLMSLWHFKVNDHMINHVRCDYKDSKLVKEISTTQYGKLTTNITNGFFFHGVRKYEGITDDIFVIGEYKNGSREGTFYGFRSKSLEIEKFYVGGVLTCRKMFDLKTRKLLHYEEITSYIGTHSLYDMEDDLINRYL